MRCLKSSLLAMAAFSLPVISASCVEISSPGVETYYVTEYITENRSEPFTGVIPVEGAITGEDLLVPYILWSSPAFSFKGTEHVWYYGYNLSGLPTHDSHRLRLTFSSQQFYEYAAASIFDMSSQGQILAPPLISASDEKPPTGVKREMLAMKNESATFNTWLDIANLKLNFAYFLGGRSDLWLNHEGPFTMDIDIRDSSDIAVIISGPTSPQNIRLCAMRLWSDRTTQYVTQSGERIVPYQVEKKVARQRAVTHVRQAPFWELYLPK